MSTYKRLQLIIWRLYIAILEYIIAFLQELYYNTESIIILVTSSIGISYIIKGLFVGLTVFGGILNLQVLIAVIAIALVYLLVKLPTWRGIESVR